jgi:hypothetical protein
MTLFRLKYEYNDSLRLDNAFIIESQDCGVVGSLWWRVFESELG